MTKRSRLAVVLPALLLLLTGCVYLRLLTVINQLADFDANFSIGGSPSWVLTLKNPPMLDKDATFLIGAPPLSVSTATRGAVYYYEFEMVRSTVTPSFPLDKLVLHLHMTGNHVSEVEVPETFLLYFSRRVLEETFRQVKNAEVFKFKKTARAAVRLSPEAAAELPSLSRTRLLLGPPLEETETPEGAVLSYRYAITGDKKGVPIAPRLFFSPEGRLCRVVIRWDTSTIDATFLPEQ